MPENNNVTPVNAAEKQYVVKIGSAPKPQIWSAEKYERNKDALYAKYGDTEVYEVTPDNGGQVNAGDVFNVHIPGTEQGQIWDADKYSRNREALAAKHPGAEVKRIRTVDYWGDQLRDLDSRIAELEGPTQEAQSQWDLLRYNEFEKGSDEEVAAGRKVKDFERELDALYRKREDNPVYKKRKNEIGAYLETMLGNVKQAGIELQKTYAPELEKHTKFNPGTSNYGIYQDPTHGMIPEYDRDSAALTAARMYYDDAIKAWNAPSKHGRESGFANFFKGLIGEAPEALSAVQLVKAIGEGVPIIDIVNKIHEHEGDEANIMNLIQNEPDKLDYLSDAQKTLLQAFVTKASVDAARANDLSLGYQAGQSAMQSLGFMADFLLTGGVGDAAAKGATQGLVKVAAKGLTKIGDGAVHTVAREGAKFGIGTLQSAVKTLAISGMMPSTYANVINNLAAINEAGEVDLSGKAIANAVGDALIENFSESAGAQVEAILGMPFKALGATGAGKLFANTKFGEWAKALKDAPAGRIMKQAGWNGFIGEIGEEWYGNALRVLTGVDPDALKNFATVEQQIITLASFAPMSILGGGASVVQYEVSKKQVESAGKYLRQALANAGYDEATIDNVLSVANAENPTELANGLAPVIVQTVTDNAFQLNAVVKAVMDYAGAVSRYRTYGGFMDADVSEKRQAMSDEISAGMGVQAAQEGEAEPVRPWVVTRMHQVPDGGYVSTNSVRVVTDKDGIEYFVQSEGEDGSLAVIDRQGKPHIISSADLTDGTMADTGEMPLNDFLDRELAKRRMSEDERRVQSQFEQNRQNLLSQAVPGATINLGTVENPRRGTIIAWQAGKFIVQDGNGAVEEVTEEQMSHILDVPYNVETEVEAISREVSDIERKEGLRTKANALKGTDVSSVLGLEGNGVLHSVSLDGEGNLVANIRIAEDNIISRPVSEDELAAIVALGEQTTPAEVKDETEAETVNEAEEQPVDDTPRDFRGNPLPMRTNKKGEQVVDETALWNNDPEAWCHYNDVNPEQIVTSAEKLEYAEKELAKQADAALKAMRKAALKGTTQDEMDDLGKTYKAQKDRLAVVQGILAEYNKPIEETSDENTTAVSQSNPPSSSSEEEVSNNETQTMLHGDSLSEGEAAELVSEMESHAEVAPEVELTPENWDAIFGNGRVSTPIGIVKMGENQFLKLMRQGRNGKLGMVKPTLENPFVVIEVKSDARDGETAERKSSYVFLKAFVKSDGSRYYYFTSITISKDGLEVVVSNQEKSRNRVMRLISESKVIWRTPKDAADSSTESQGLDYAQPEQVETATKGSEITPQNTPSTDKDTNSSEETNEESADSKSEVIEEEAGIQTETPAAQVEQPAPLTDAQKQVASELLGVSEEEMEARNEELQEQKRQEPLKARAKEWEARTGVKVNTISSIDEVSNKQARKAIESGETVFGWFEPKTGTVCLYLPHVPDESEIDKTYIHEVVSHKGLRQLLGEEGFNSLMDSVWNDMMSDEDKASFLASVSHVKGSELDKQRAAADEFVASYAENLDLTKPNSKWDKFVEAVREILAKLGISLKVNEKDLSTLLQASLARYEKMQAEKREDGQGNPLNEDGTLKLERVNSIDELTDEDFTNPTRSVELPTLSKNVDAAIGANGKPVIIKKNIFEKNKRSHSDLSPEQSRDILNAALYNPDLYGQNQKTSRPYNWVVINTVDRDGKNRLVVLEVADNKDNVEIVNWHFVRDNALNTLKRQAEREGGLILILPSESTEEAGGLSSRPSDLSSEDKDSEKSTESNASTSAEKREDGQGNPLNEDGTLKLERVNSIDELTDEDFTNPTRSVELPTLPKNVDAAIGANGKPVIIKKNIFRKNSERHDYTPAENRGILAAALYSPNLVGQTKPSTKASYWVAIKVDDNSSVTILEVSDKKDNIEVVGWYTLDERNLERMKRQAEREGGELLILTPEKSAAASLSTLPSDLSSEDKDSEKSTETSTSASEEASQPTEAQKDVLGRIFGMSPEEVEKEHKARKSRKKDEEQGKKIEDFGEKIAGARKDGLRELSKSLEDATEESFVALALSKAFKRPNTKKLVEDGVLSPEDATFVDAVSWLILGSPKPTKLKGGYKAERRDQEILEWAKEQAQRANIIHEYINADEAGKKAIIGNLSQISDEVKSSVDARRNRLVELNNGWNDVKIGKLYPLNPVYVAYRVFQSSGYDPDVHGRVKFPVIKCDAAGNSYTIEIGENGSRFIVRSVEDALSRASYLVQLQLGAEDLDHPASVFGVHGIRDTKVLSGAYRVFYYDRRRLAMKEFNSKDAAVKFAMAKYPGKTEEELLSDSSIKEIEKWADPTKFKIVCKDAVTGETYELDKVYGSKEDAVSAIDSNHEGLNSQFNSALQKAREAKGEAVNKGDKLYVAWYYKDGRGSYGVFAKDKSFKEGYVLFSGGFETSEAARTYMEEHRAKYEGLLENMAEQRRRFVFFDGNASPRKGKDYRHGKDVGEEDYKVFGFRGVQFGNWTNNADRQAALNNAYDAFMDLADVLGVSPAALSLNGELGLAFGARGGGNASAHYETSEVVINLTKTKGAGSLAHEWWHALDNYFARHGGIANGFLTESYVPGVRPAVRMVFEKLTDAVRKSNYGERSSDRGVYWGSAAETTARLFAEWVDHKMAANGESNHFLVRGVSDEKARKYEELNYIIYEMVAKSRIARDPNTKEKILTFEEFRKTPDALVGFPYPTTEEIKTTFGPLMQEVFDTIEEKSEDGKQVLFRKAGNGRRWYGGNSGYVGYSMSKRAAEAREEGKFPKTDFMNEYGVSKRDLDELVNAGVINNSEWHHTGKYGNKTTFYGWEIDDYARIYTENKNEIKELIGELVKKRNPITPSTEVNPYTYSNARTSLADRLRAIDDSYYRAIRKIPEVASDDALGFWRELGQDVISKQEFDRRMAELKSEYEQNRKTAIAEASPEDRAIYEENERYDEFNSKKETPIEYEMRVKKEMRPLRDFFDSRVKDEADDRVDAALYRKGSSSSIVEVNERFNEDIDRYANGEMQSREYLTVGLPSGPLSIFVVNKPIILRQSILTKAAKKHGVDASHVKNLPVALSEPIFIFKSSQKTISVLTELKTSGGKNIFVAMELDAQKQLGHEFLEVNDILTVHGREEENVINPIVANDSLKWVDKEKGQRWLSSAKSNSQAIDNEDLISATKIVEDFENPTLPEEDYTMFRRVTDKSALDRLNGEPTIKTYRAMQLIDGKLYPPMAGKVNGEWQYGIPVDELGTIWEEAEEHPELVDDKGNFKLDKGNGKSLKARYNPYIHTSLTPLNDQFSSAQTRPELVTVEVEVPESELTSGYKADKAKDAVGEVEWKAGVIQSQLSGTRTVILSRWDRPVRVVPESEVADVIVEMFGDKDITMPSNVVTPALRTELEKRGVPFVETDNQGRRIQDDDTSFRKYSPEESRSIARAQEDGTYLMAPNGEQSNLAPRQWAQVRTESFKNWFGDWEKAARIEKLKNGKTVEISGDEVMHSDDIKQYRKNALEYGKNLQGVYTNGDTGEAIRLHRGRKNGGVNEVLQHNYKDVEHLQSVAAIPQIIEDSIYIDSEPNQDIAKNPDVAEYQHFVCGLKIGDIDYTVHSIVAVDNHGNRYYDHNLTRIEKTKLLDLIKSQAGFDGGFGATPDTKSTTSSEYKVRKLVRLLQTDSSEVVDASGEPLVVYHGSRSTEDFGVFDNTRSDKKAIGSGNKEAYFFSDKSTADIYANDIPQGTLYEGDGHVVPAYLSIKNPARIDYEGASFNGNGYEAEYYDVLFEEWIPVRNNGNKYFPSENAAIDAIKSIIPDETLVEGENFNVVKRERVKPAIAEWIDGVDRGEHDGAIVENIGETSDSTVTDYVAFRSDQIKSATENNGDFSEDNPDIRFRKESMRRAEMNRVNSTIDNVIAFVQNTSKSEARAYRQDWLNEHRRNFAEICERTLSGNFDSVTLGLIDKYISDATPKNPYGRRISQRVPQAMERGLYEGARANAVDALFTRVSESSIRETGSSVARDGARRSIEEKKKELLKGWAVATGNWHTSISDFTNDSTPIGSGKDSDVYASKDGDGVIKVSKGKDNQKKFRPDIDAVNLFNYAFPNSAYEIVGYGEIDGKFVKFLKQPIVDFAQSAPLTELERVSYMEGLGFHPINKERTAFSDGTIAVADLQKSNIVKDKAGNVSVIDADVKLHTKDFGGSYTYPDVSEDFPDDDTRFRKDYTASEIAEMDTPILHTKGTFKNLEEAEKWAKTNLQGKEFTNRHTGENIRISGKSISEMLAEKFVKKTNAESHKAALRSVPDFIETGIPAEVHPDYHGNGYDIMRLYSAFEFDDELYRVKSTIKRLKEGDRYYTYELQEMELVEGTQASAVGLDGNPVPSSINSISGAKLLKGVKKTNSDELILPEDEDNARFRRRGMAVPVQGEDESDIDFAQRCIDRISYTYNAMADGVSVTDEDSDRGGEYDPSTGKVTIFAKHGNDFFVYEDTYFHENLHAFIDKEYDGAEEEIKEFYENARLNHPRGFDICVQALRDLGYIEETLPEELFVYTVSKRFVNGKLVSDWHLFDLGEQNIIEEYAKRIGYDIKEEEQLRSVFGFSDKLRMRDSVREETSERRGGEESEGGRRSEAGGARGYTGDGVDWRSSSMYQREVLKETARMIGAPIEFVHGTYESPAPGMVDASGRSVVSRWNRGRVQICPNLCRDANDAVCTYLHEAVGHSGLSSVFDRNQRRKLYLGIYNALPDAVRREVAGKAVTQYGGSVVAAVESFLSNDAIQEAKGNPISVIEDSANPEEYRKSVWNVVRDGLTSALRGKGLDVSLSSNDAKWLMAQSAFPNHEVNPLEEATRQVVANHLGFTRTQQAYKADGIDAFRFRRKVNFQSDSAAEIYDRAVSNAWGRLKESYVDMYQSVEEGVKAIEQTSGKPARAFENVLLALNQQSSKALATMQRWQNTKLAPMMKAIVNLANAMSGKVEDVERYVMLKHGLERNDVFAKRDALDFYQKAHDNAVKTIEKSSLGDAEKASRIADEDDKLDMHRQEIDNGTDVKYLKLREKDYSGLTGMYMEQGNAVQRMPSETDLEFTIRLMKARHPKFVDKNGDIDLAAIEDEARREVEAMENAHSNLTDVLWDTVNAATRATLKEQYEANLLSREQYVRIRDMFEYYVPLRGFDDETSDDFYSYYAGSSHSGYVNPIMRAEGRKSKAESPFGYIAAAESSAVAQGSKNMTKLALYYFVANRADNGLLSVSDAWYKQVGLDQDDNPIYEVAYPNIPENATRAEVEQAVSDFEADMKRMEEAGLAFKGKNKLSLYGGTLRPSSSKMEHEHVIPFKLAGKDMTLIVHGNPRMAQAFTGSLNYNAENDAITKFCQEALRFMAALNTQMNPEFWISNFQRDLLFSMMAVNVKEDKDYQRRFKNNLKSSIKNVIKYKKAYDNGTLGNSYEENLYRQFVDNGGVTGYTVMHDNAYWERRLKEFAGEERNVVTKIVNAFKGISDFGESFEQMTRFAAFCTSVEMGKDIREAVADAKNLSVNFNRKGSGKSISYEEAKKLRLGKDGKQISKFEAFMIHLMSVMSPVGRRTVMFFNAAIQGLSTTWNLAKANPAKMAGWSTLFVLVGAANAALHAMLDDDDDDYLDIPDYERRNNAMLGYNGVYLKWALPQEMRVFYGLGDMMVDHMLGRSPDKSLPVELLGAMGEVLPVNPVEGILEWDFPKVAKSVLPSVVTPVMDIVTNEDYKGAKVHNDYRYYSKEVARNIPKYRNPLPNTSKIFVGISQAANFLSGGDDVQAGWMNFDPNNIEHLWQGYTGGFGTAIGKGVHFVENTLNGEFAVRDTPFLRRLLVLNDERYRNSHTTDLYYYYKAQAENTKRILRELKSDPDRYMEFMDSDEYETMLIFDINKKQLEYYDEEIRSAEDEDTRRALMQEQDALRKEMILEISEIGKND